MPSKKKSKGRGSAAATPAQSGGTLDFVPPELQQAALSLLAKQPLKANRRAALDAIKTIDWALLHPKVVLSMTHANVDGDHDADAEEAVLAHLFWGLLQRPDPNDAFTSIFGFTGEGIMKLAFEIFEGIKACSTTTAKGEGGHGGVTDASGDDNEDESEEEIIEESSEPADLRTPMAQRLKEAVANAHAQLKAAQEPESAAA